MGAQPGGEAAAWRLRDSLFHYRFCCRLTAGRYRFDLILFDCLKGQKIGLTFLQPKFEQEPSLCASILGITRKSYGLPEHTRQNASVSFPKLHTHLSTFLVDHRLPGRGWGKHRQSWQLRGTYSSTCPSSPCTLPEGSDHRHEPIPFTCRFDAQLLTMSCPTWGIQTAFGYLDIYIYIYISWLRCWLFTQCVTCPFCISSDADYLSLCHCCDIVILGLLTRSNQTNVQCTASAR